MRGVGRRVGSLRGASLSFLGKQNEAGYIPCSCGKVSNYCEENSVIMEIRVGIGYDSHRLAPGSGLRLGGVFVPHDRSAVAHSDGDVLLHAVIDAILGALAQGDIGEHFPDNDPSNKGRNSCEMLAEIWEKAHIAGWQVGNLDCTIFAERPRLGTVKEQIRRSLARLLDSEVSRINVKAKTGEGVGPIGREELIAAEVAVLLLRETG